MQESWLQKIGLVNETIKKKKRVPNISSFKIAVLDTGCDAEAPSLRLPGRKKIKLWKDFVENSPTLTDDHGHGTHLATLILQIAPYAELCVARVAKQSEGLQYAEGNIVKVRGVSSMGATASNNSVRPSIRLSLNGTLTSSRCPSDFQATSKVFKK